MVTCCSICETIGRFTSGGLLRASLVVAMSWVSTSGAIAADPVESDAIPGLMGRLPLPPSDGVTGIYQLRFSPDGRTLAARDGSQKILLFDLHKRQLLSRLVGHEQRIQDFCFIRDGRQLVSVTDNSDDGCRVWDAATGQSTRLPLTGRIVAEYYDDQIGVFSEQQAQLFKLPFVPENQRTIQFARNSQLQPLAVSPNGNRILYSSLNTSRDLLGNANHFLLHVVNTGTTKTTSIKGDVGVPHAAVVFRGPIGGQVAIICRRQNRLLWRSSVNFQKNRERAHDDAIGDICVTPDGRYLATCSWDGSTKIWETVSFEPLLELKKLKGKALCVEFSRDGKMLAVAGNSADDGIWVWNLHELLLGESIAPAAGTVPLHWDALATDFASDAYRSLAWMAQHESESLDFLERTFEAKTVDVTPEQLAQWIDALQSDSFNHRKTAFKELYELRTVLKSRLEGILASTDSVEVELQLRRLLSAEWKENRLAVNERKQLARVLFLLESFGNSRADRILKTIANTESDDPIYEHAAQVWARRTQREF